MEDLIFKELTYKIIGAVFDVYNKIGYGHSEKYYQKAIAIALAKSNINYKKELCVPLKYGGENIGRYFFDFLIENKIVLELKKGNKFYRRDIEQSFSYLKSANLKLALLIRFTSKGVLVKRIVNIKK